MPRTPHIPRLAGWMLATALPASQRAHWMGDLDEEYRAHVLPARGPMRARLWYWRQAMGSIPAALRRRMRPGAPGLPGGGRNVPGGGLRLDLRSALRSLRQRPGYAIVAVLTLALGIGANVAVFTVVNATVLRGLPYADPGTLIRFWPDALFSHGTAELMALREAAPAGVRYSAYGRSLATFTGGQNPEMVRGAVVPWDHFDILGVAPLLGRAFVEGEGEPGRDQVIVLEHGFWTRRFGGDPDLVGQTVEIRGQAWLVAGVMPASHQPLETDWEFWRPLDLLLEGAEGPALAVVGRRPAAMSLEQASAAYRETIVDRWAGLDYAATPEDLASLVGAPLSDWMLGAWRTRLLLLLGAVLVVLLIACTNVANLMLARTLSRGDELGLRAALGAGRPRVARLVFVEAAVLAVAGAGLGIAGAYAIVNAVRGGIPADVPRIDRIAVDPEALAYAVGVTMLATLAFGLAPALRGAARASGAAGDRTTGSRLETRVSRAFIAGQVALAVVLVVGSGLLLRSFWKLRGVDPGFNAESVVALRPAPPSSAYPAEDDFRVYHESVTQVLEGIQGVRSVGGIMFLPMQPGGWWTQYTATRADGAPAEGRAGGRVVRGAYFETMEVPLLAGRTFTPADAEGPPLVIVNKALADEAWPGERPVGKILNFSREDHEVVGVVGDVHQQELATPAVPEVYVPYSQQTWRNIYFVARVDGPADEFVPRIRDAIRGLDPRVPINGLVAMPDVVAGTAAGSKFLASFVLVFGAVALLLGMIGVYGVTAYAVAQQRRDIGVRMAVGAHRSVVLRQTLASGARPVAIGLALGMLVAFGTARFLQGFLFEVAPLDPATFLAVPGLLVAAAMLALWVPARRATRIDPALVLRDG